VAWADAAAVPVARTAAALQASASLPRRDYAKDADVEVTVVIENGTAASVDIAAQVLAAPQLLLEVRDAAGEVVRTVPPPTPTGDADRRDRCAAAGGRAGRRSRGGEARRAAPLHVAPLAHGDARDRPSEVFSWRDGVLVYEHGEAEALAERLRAALTRARTPSA
jgi:hypothetical protein